MQKIILLFALLSYPLGSFAQGFQLHQQIKSEPQDYSSSHKSRLQRPWWAASNAEVLVAPCRSPVDVAKIERELAKKAALRRSSPVEVRKASFTTGSAELINAFKDLVTKYEFFGVEAEESEQINIQKTFSINPKCQDVLCASRIIFGEVRGPLVLYLRYQYGMNASHLVAKNAAKANRRELLSFLRAMSDFPKHLFPLESNKRMTRFKRGLTLQINDGRTLANARMNFFDGWEDLGLEGKIGRKDYVVTHEVGHVLGDALKLHGKQEWLDLSGWRETDEGPQHAGEHHFISGYSMTNPREDFAETLSAYRYSPEALKVLVPEKYDFMKHHVFGGLEYIGRQTCGTPERSPLYRQLEIIFGQAQNFTLKKLKKFSLKASPFYGEDLASYLSGKQSKKRFLKSLQAGLAYQVFIEEESSLTKFEKISRARHLGLVLKNTSFSLLNKQQMQKVSVSVLEEMKKLMAQAIFERRYLYYTRDAQGEQEIIQGCKEYSQYGIYSQELKKFLGNQRSFSKLKNYSSKLMFDYCTETIQKLGPSAKPEFSIALDYIKRRLEKH